MTLVDFKQQAVLALEMIGDAAGIGARLRIDTALKPLVENSSSAALRMASRMLGFRVMAFAFRSLVLYVCTKYKV
jgi:hypothetical protein